MKKKRDKVRDIYKKKSLNSTRSISNNSVHNKENYIFYKSVHNNIFFNLFQTFLNCTEMYSVYSCWFHMVLKPKNVMWCNH